MRKFLLPLTLVGALHAGITDFHTLSKAEKAYNGGNYGEASNAYGSLQDKNDEARFNYGDALYKQKKYKEAAAQFSQIKTPSLKQKSLYNLGNSLANLGKTDDAIKAYEEALKLGKDADAQYNLDLLKKQQKQQKQQQKDNKQDQNKKDRKQQKNQQQDGQGKNGKNDQDKQKNKDNQQQSGKDDQKDQQNRQGQSQEAQNPKQQQNQQKQDQSERSKQKQAQQQQTKSEAQKGDEKKQANAQAQPATAQPISNMEENKYNKMLDKRGIKTLMIPLSGKGEPHEDDKTPW